MKRLMEEQIEHRRKRSAAFATSMDDMLTMEGEKHEAAGIMFAVKLPEVCLLGLDDEIERLKEEVNDEDTSNED